MTARSFPVGHPLPVVPHFNQLEPQPLLAVARSVELLHPRSDLLVSLADQVGLPLSHRRHDVGHQHPLGRAQTIPRLWRPVPIAPAEWLQQRLSSQEPSGVISQVVAAGRKPKKE